MNYRKRQFERVALLCVCLLSLLIIATVIAQAIASGWRLPFRQPLIARARTLTPSPVKAGRPGALPIEPGGFRADRIGQLALDADAHVPLSPGEPATGPAAGLAQRRFALADAVPAPAPTDGSVTAATREFLKTNRQREFVEVFGMEATGLGPDEKQFSSFGSRQKLVVRVADELTGANVRRVELAGE